MCIRDREKREKESERFSCRELAKELRENYDEAISRLLFPNNFRKNI